MTVVASAPRTYQRLPNATTRRIYAAYWQARRAGRPAPVLRELAARVGISSTSVVRRHVQWLIRAGALRETQGPRTVRTLVVTEPLNWFED